ncbi:MAG: MaoC/PaaZ C-terminal domain-containing protein [Myxococcales bacterium]
MAAPKRLYLESLRIGDELPSLVKPAIDRVQIARFAGAANDFNPMHIDETQAKTAGMPSVFAHSLLPMSFMSQFLTDWLRGGRLTRLAVRFVKLVWPGDVLSCKGRVLARRRDEQGRYFVDVDLWAENQKGELVLKGHSTGQIYYNAEDENRQKRGDGPLIVDVSEQTELPRNAKGKPVKPKATPVLVRAPAPAPLPAPVAMPVVKKPAPKPAAPAKKPVAKVAGKK